MAGIGVPSGAVSDAVLVGSGATVTVRALDELAHELVRRGLVRS
jgi:hypothetical protein